jgi:hypothetical protein
VAISDLLFFSHEFHISGQGARVYKALVIGRALLIQTAAVLISVLEKLRKRKSGDFQIV